MDRLKGLLPNLEQLFMGIALKRALGFGLLPEWEFGRPE